MGILPVMERNKDKKADNPSEEFYMGYGINTPGSGGAKIYNIVKYNDDTSSNHSTVDFYCVKAGIGFTSVSGVQNNRQRYNVSYNMKTERSEIAKLTSDNDVYKNLVEKDINGINRYDALLAALDMLYIPGKSTDAEKQNLKNNIIQQAAKEDASVIQKIADIKAGKYPLTDNDIVATQQAAIWYFTNYGEDDSKYDHTDKEDNESWLTYSSDGGSTYKALNNYTLSTDSDQRGSTRGELRAFQAHMLYKYIIEQAKANANKYTNVSATTTAPATVTQPSVSQNAGTLGYEISGENYLIGPICITENTANTLPYTIDFTVKVNGSPNTSYTILKNKTDRVDNVQQTLGQNFYISIPKNDVNTVSVNVKFNYRDTEMTLWASTEYTNEQPLVELKETPLTTEVNLTATPKEPEKKFDLALRKYITKINGTAIENTRTPDIDESTLTAPDGTTATYKHRKDPVVVSLGNTITYNLTVYNEGEKNGYATKIVDQLPAGLKLVENSIIGNYEIDPDHPYSESTNMLYLKRKSGVSGSLQAYTGSGDPQSESVEITCEVTANPDKNNSKVLTNIAWISEAFDAEAEGGGAITDSDIDSQTSNSPSVSNDNMPNYKGHAENPEPVPPTLEEMPYFKGQQDDDDFEKVKILPEAFDLKLIKYISAVNNNPEPERIESVDVSNLNRTDENGNMTGTTATYTMNKEPVHIKLGDIVTYTFRVYNEGTIDGYAQKIVEDIPEGLELIWSDKQGEELQADTSLTDAEKEAISFNQDYLWGDFEYDEEGDKIVRISSTYLSKENESTLNPTLIKAFGKNDGSKTERDLSYKDLAVKLRVVSRDIDGTIIRNEAAISEHIDKNGNEVTDRDSHPGKDEDTWTKQDSDKFYKEDNKWPIYEEDDEDYDNVILESFDLALRKFIVAVSKDSDIDESDFSFERQPSVDTSKLNTLDEEGNIISTATYNHSKEPVDVKKKNYIVYMLRAYNEGSLNAYAGEIKDYLPEYLEFVDGDFNRKYGWSVSSDGRTVTTNYLANKLINKAELNKLPTSDAEKYVLDYEEVPIMCYVKDTAKTGENMTNIAEITEYKDEKNQKVEDRDSYEENLDKPGDEDLPEYNEHQEDDDDFEKVVIQPVDLVLRKFIAAVSRDNNIQDNEYLRNEDGSYTREPVVDTSKLNTLDDNGDLITTAVYNQSKEPVEVKREDYIVYILRVYNEGNIDAYAGEIEDYLPEYLEFVDGSFNEQYGWEVSEDERTVKTKYLADKLIKKAELNESATSDAERYNLDYEEVPIMCHLNDSVKANQNVTNIADITKYEDEDHEPVEDRDSVEDNVEKPEDKDLPEYNENQEDDDDFEKVVVKRFDLALRKFITKVNEENIDTRVPQPRMQENGQIKYEHSKGSVDVVQGDIVTYTIRVYNEGKIDGYASEIADDIPDGLEFLPQNETNTEYRWVMYDATGKETDDVKNAETVKTDYLSKEQGEARMEDDEEENPALLKAFNAEEEIKDTNPDYKDVKIAFRIVESNSSDKVIVNSAQVTQNTDKDGDPVKDEDSTPDEWNDGEDDQDQEFVERKEFDLSLKKWVTQAIVIENGKETVTQTGHQPYDDPEDVVKVEIHRNKLNNVTVKFRYSIRVTNEGDIAGYAKEVTDYVPNGLKFVASENPGWKDEGNNVISTRQLENTLLQPGEHAEVQVLLTWVNNQSNMGVMDNTAEISEDYNDKGVPDRNSTPDNKKDGENDMDNAPVLLTIGTGKGTTYFALGFIVLVTIAGGAILIKKYVL